MRSSMNISKHSYDAQTTPKTRGRLGLQNVIARSFLYNLCHCNLWEISSKLIYEGNRDERSLCNTSPTKWLPQTVFKVIEGD